MTTQEMETVGKKFRLRVDEDADMPSHRLTTELEYVGVKASETTSYWCLIFPPNDSDDSNWGWDPMHYLSPSELAGVGLGAEGWRGWYVHESNVEVLGPVEEPEVLSEVSEDDDPVVLRRRLASLTDDLVYVTSQRDLMTERYEAAEAKLLRVRDEGERIARARGYCGVYDEIMEAVGLEGRVRTWLVKVHVEYDSWAEVSSRSKGDAEAQVDDAEPLRNWRPPSPFASLEIRHYAENVTFDVGDAELADD